MANTLPSLQIIAQESLPVLQKLAPNLRAFTTDYSEDIAQEGASVSIRIPVSRTANSFNGTSLSFNSAAVTSGNVVLNPIVYDAVSLTDSDVGNLTMPRLINTFMAPIINSVINYVVSGTLALVTTGNFGSAAYVGTTSNFQNCVATPLQALQSNGVSSDKSIVLNTSGYWGLLNDVKAANVIGDAQLIREGRIGNLAGAQIVESAQVPSTSNMFGFAAGKEAIAIATRLPGIPADAPILEVANIVDPISNLSIQLRKWYDPNALAYKIGTFIMYGAAVGNPSGIAIMTTA